MAIKKRVNLPQGDLSEEPAVKGPLVIVAKPKQPLPPPRFTVNAAGPISPQSARALGNLAMACGEDIPDAAFSVADRLALIRTPYDKNNPQEQRYRNRVKNRATAITAFCITCVGSRKLVTECAATECPLWAFRFGSDPFRGKRK